MLHISDKKAPGRVGKTFHVNVIYQKDFDVAIVTALLDKLGLNRFGLLELFNRQYFQGNFVLFCVNQIRNQENSLAYNTKLARTMGQVTVPVIVQASLLELIARFFKEVAVNIAQRFAESQYRYLLSDIYTGYGITKDIQESFTDTTQGIKKIISGFWDGNTSTVGSQRFKNGWNRFFAGIGQTGIGYEKFGLQMPLNAFATKIVNMISSWQTLFSLESLGRLLTTAETSLLKTVFGSAVEYDAIRIKEGYAGIFSAGLDNGVTLTNNNRALTVCNTIYMKNTPANDWNHILVHETTHVWQFQNGGTDYMCEALFAQVTEGYDFANAITKQKRSWAALNPEQQAYLIELSYINGYFNNGGWSNSAPIPDPGNPPNYVQQSILIAYMNQVKPQLQSGRGAT